MSFHGKDIKFASFNYLEPQIFQGSGLFCGRNAAPSGQEWTYTSEEQPIRVRTELQDQNFQSFGKHKENALFFIAMGTDAFKGGVLSKTRIIALCITLFTHLK